MQICPNNVESNSPVTTILLESHLKLFKDFLAGRDKEYSMRIYFNLAHTKG